MSNARVRTFAIGNTLPIRVSPPYTNNEVFTARNIGPSTIYLIESAYTNVERTQGPPLEAFDFDHAWPLEPGEVLYDLPGPGPDDATVKYFWALCAPHRNSVFIFVTGSSE